MLLSFYLKRLIFIIYLIYFNGFSQIKGDYIFRTDFNPRDQQLFLEENRSVNLYVYDGVYYMNINNPDTFYNPSFVLPLNPDNDFIMGTSLKVISGNMPYNFGASSENIPFGLTFEDKAEKIVNAFLIYNNGNFEIIKGKGKVKETISGPSFSPFIKKDAYNVLLVEKIGNAVYFFINYKCVASVPSSSFKGHNYGLVVVGGQQVACDYFYVKQKRGSINLIENYDKFGGPEKFELETNNNNAQTEPIISADGEEFYYTSVDVQKGKTVFQHRLCERDENGIWQVKKTISFPNTKKNISVLGISADKNEILLGTRDTLFSSHKLAQGWSVPKQLPFKDHYNTSDLGAGVCPSSDFKILIMPLEQKDRYGLADLYVSFFKDSVWTKPLNLGKNINSCGEDLSPFLAPDNKTLYFSSNGWPGYGGFDIFMSTRLDDSWTRWSEPKNLGPAINTSYGDVYYNTSASGNEAYLARCTQEDKYYHIYRIKQPGAAAPEPIVLVKGTVLDSQTGQPLSAVINYNVIGESKSLGHVHSNEHNGTFAISLPKGKKYIFYANKKGFISEQKSSSSINLKKYKAEKIELLLTPLKKGSTFIMHNLFFANNQAAFLRESETELTRLYFILKENQSLKIEISGHTQLNNATAKFNRDLSLARAVAVKDYLVKKGIDQERIITNGYGQSQPIETVKTDKASQAINRRVEFKILEN